jgi:hypothetical protein
MSGIRRQNLIAVAAKENRSIANVNYDSDSSGGMTPVNTDPSTPTGVSLGLRAN